MRLLLLFVLVGILLSAHNAAGVVVTGTITFDGQSVRGLNIVVQCYQLVYDPLITAPLPIYASTIYLNTPIQQLNTTTSTYTFNLTSGYYSFFAYQADSDNEDIKLDAPIGWWGNELTASSVAYMQIGDQSSYTADINMKKSTLYPQEAKGRYGGHLRKMKGFNVLTLKGTKEERGYDHGYLAAHQILDWFRFYVLEALMAPPMYLTKGVAFLQNVMSIDADFKAEGNALLNGMIDSGVNMTIRELNKEFDLLDLYSISAYIELGYKAESCSQFAVWGESTLDGNLIAARNMDGELDIRKVTVSHLTIFAIEPSEPNQNKFISIMWPGFLGTLTGFNEHGLYGMMNTGICNTGPAANNAQPVSWAMRGVLQTLTAETATPEATMQVLSKYKSSGGGISASGAIFVYARNNSQVSNGPNAYVFEGDVYGGLMRHPGQVDPYGDDFIMATNHNKVYGVNPFKSGWNWQIEASFGSLARYWTGSNTMGAWKRNNYKATVESLQDMLQRVAHAATEHSVIWTPHNRNFYVANAKWEPTQWDAPYQDWTRFVFEEVF